MDTSAGEKPTASSRRAPSPRSSPTCVAPLLVGKAVPDIPATWQRHYDLMRVRGHWSGFFTDALAAVDIALWDLAGKRAGKRVAELLGEVRRERIPAYASGLPRATLPERVALAPRTGRARVARRQVRRGGRAPRRGRRDARAAPGARRRGRDHGRPALEVLADGRDHAHPRAGAVPAVFRRGAVRAGGRRRPGRRRGQRDGAHRRRRGVEHRLPGASAHRAPLRARHPAGGRAHRHLAVRRHRRASPQRTASA